MNFRSHYLLRVGHVDIRAAREDEVPRRCGLGRGEDGRNKPLLHHLAVIEDGNVVAHLLHHAHLVRDDDDGDAELFIDVADQLEDLARRLWVERARRLVENDYRRVFQKQARD